MEAKLRTLGYACDTSLVGARLLKVPVGRLTWFNRVILRKKPKRFVMPYLDNPGTNRLVEGDEFFHVTEDRGYYTSTNGVLQINF